MIRIEPEYNTNNSASGQNLQRGSQQSPKIGSNLPIRRMSRDDVQGEGEGEEDYEAPRQAIRTTSSGARVRVQMDNRSGGRLPNRRYMDTDESQVSKTSPIDKTTFVLMLSVATIFDLASFVINFILPAAGGVIDSILITPIATLTFYLWFKKRGVDYSKSSRRIMAIAAPLIEFIPVVNALPAWILEILVFNASLKAEQKLKE